VGKALEATLVVLYVGLVTATLYGGAVPEYRTTAGEEVADRTAAHAAATIERAVPPEAVAADSRVDVDLPGTIAGAAYRIYVEGGRVVLDHPDPDVSTTVPLVVPDRVLEVEGSWESGGSSSVRVVSVDGGLEVRLE
jgi:hypothetical protein